ncbi:hypothetical protein [Alsobacter sp. R-9]
MKALQPLVLGFVILATAACQTAVQDKENMLSAAGFQMRPADTPEKITAIRTLPPHRFVQQTNNGQPVWIYADPTICGCLYVGNQQAWQTYRQMVFQQNLANEQQMTAMMNQSFAFDYGMWGFNPLIY